MTDLKAKTKLKTFPVGALSFSGQTLSLSPGFVFATTQNPGLHLNGPTYILFGVYKDAEGQIQVFWEGKTPQSEKTLVFPEEITPLAVGGGYSGGIWGARSTPRYGLTSGRRVTSYENATLEIPSQNHCLETINNTLEFTLGSFIFNYYVFFRKSLTISNEWIIGNGFEIGGAA